MCSMKHKQSNGNDKHKIIFIANFFLNKNRSLKQDGRLDDDSDFVPKTFNVYVNCANKHSNSVSNNWYWSRKKTISKNRIHT